MIFKAVIRVGAGYFDRSSSFFLIGAGSSGGDLRALSPSTLAAALSEAGAARLDPADDLPTLVDLLVLSGLARSKGEARRTVGEGGAYLNNERIEDPDYAPTDDDLIGGSWLVLRRGKKNFAGVELLRP